MKGTKLYQQTGSPLISGYSKRTRPFWRDVVVGWVLSVGVVALAGAFASIAWDRPDDGALGGLASLFTPGTVAASTAFAAVPCAIGGLAGVWLARRMGWRSCWLAGLAVGVLAGFAWLAMSAVDVATV